MTLKNSVRNTEGWLSAIVRYLQYGLGYGYGLQNVCEMKPVTIKAVWLGLSALAQKM